MSKEMKLIMENWRRLREDGEDIPDEEMQAMLAQAMQGLGIAGINESDNFFKGLLAGGLMAIAPLIYGIYAQDAEDAQRYRAAAAQAAQQLSSTETKISELDKQLNSNTRAWSWSDDVAVDPSTGDEYKAPHSSEMFPTVVIEGNEMAVMAPSWSISMQVLQDKQAGTINVPGFSEGEVPPIELIIKILDSHSSTNTDSETASFVEDFKPYLQNTTDMGATIHGVGGVLCDGEIGCATVAVNPAVFDDIPNYHLPDSGMTAQETYIKVFFGQYLGAEEALRYGEVP